MAEPAQTTTLKHKLPLLLLAGIAALTPLAVDMYLPAIPQIADMLDSEIAIVQNSLSIFLVGFGLGMLIFGPFSDRFGRRPLALFGLTGFALSSLLLTLSDNITVFLILRLLQGFLGSAASVVIPAMIRDSYGKDTAKGMSAVTMIMLVAPLIAPMLGSLLLHLGSWRIIFGTLTLYPFLLIIIAWYKLPETRPVDEPGERRSIFGNYKIILANKNIYLDLVCFMLTALAFFTYLTSVSFVYITWYGVSETLFGILFACSASALIIANFINIRVVSRVGTRRMMIYGLLFGCVSSLGLLLVTYLGLNVFWTVASFVLIVGSLGIASINADALVLIQFPKQASSASAVTGTLRFGCGAMAGPILAWTYNGTPMPVAILMICAMFGATFMQVLRRVILKPGAD